MMLSDAEWLEPFDYAIGSAHFCPSAAIRQLIRPWTAARKRRAVFWRKLSAATATRRRNAILPSLNASPTNPRAQIVGHFDLLTKFDEKEHFFDETSLRYRAAALDAMDALVSAGKIFEVNTGAISRGWRTTPYPSRWVLEQLKRRNAQVTISSDSHGVGTVDCAFDRAKPCLKPVGLRKSGCSTERRLRHRKLNKQSPADSAVCRLRG